MEQIKGHFNTPKKHRIFYQAWLPEGDIKAVVLLVHGMGEHSGRYLNLVNHLVPLGYAIYGLDHLGHGRSSGKRKYIESFNDYLEPLGIYHAMIQSWQPEQPLFLLGHSMGGTIAVAYLLEHQTDFSGAVLSCPALKPAAPVSTWLRKICDLLSKLVPMVGVMPIEPEALCHDEDVIQAYVSDPLVSLTKSPARLVSIMLHTMDELEKEVYRLNLPFLVVQGEKDRVVHPDGARMIYDKAGSGDKTLNVYDGLLHEIMNEPQKEMILSDIARWLENHLI